MCLDVYSMYICVYAAGPFADFVRCQSALSGLPASHSPGLSLSWPVTGSSAGYPRFKVSAATWMLVSCRGWTEGAPP